MINSWEYRESNLGLLDEKRACYLCAMLLPPLNMKVWACGNSQAASEEILRSWVNESRGVVTRRNDYCRIVVYPRPQGKRAPHKTEWLRFEHQLAGKKSSNCFAAKFWKLSKQKSPTVKIFSIKFSIFLRLTSTSLWHARIAVVLLLLAFYFKSTFQENMIFFRSGLRFAEQIYKNSGFLNLTFSLNNTVQRLCNNW